MIFYALIFKIKNSIKYFALFAGKIFGFTEPASAWAAGSGSTGASDRGDAPPEEAKQRAA